ncbi:MAG TPA: hypothetical protein VIE87_13880 [Pseudolabrys sp.]
MNKRDRFIAELREEARGNGLSFRAETWRGKGGHMMVFVGDRLTTVPSRRSIQRRQERSGSNWVSRIKRRAIAPAEKEMMGCALMSIARNSSAARGAGWS